MLRNFLPYCQKTCRYIVIFAFLAKPSYQCAATSSTATPTTVAPAGCKSCTLAQVEILSISPGTKDFTSDTIDTSGTCSVRTSVCDGNAADDAVLISYNRDDDGVDRGTGSVTSILTCNTAGQWIKTSGTDMLVITSFECQST